MARREAREYREYLSAEQRSQPGCPARELCREPRGQDTRSHLTNGVPTRTRKHENAKTRNNLKVFFFVVSCFRGFVIVLVYETRSSGLSTLIQYRQTATKTRKRNRKSFSLIRDFVVSCPKTASWNDGPEVEHTRHSCRYGTTT